MRHEETKWNCNFFVLEVSQIFSLKGQRVSISAFAGHIWSLSHGPFFFFLETFENGKPGYTKQTWLQFSDPALGQTQSTITVDLELMERPGVAEATELILTKLLQGVLGPVLSTL